jgi:hypothetical protein
MPNGRIRSLREITLTGSQRVVVQYTQLLLRAFATTYGPRVDVRACTAVRPFGESGADIHLTWKESLEHSHQ